MKSLTICFLFLASIVFAQTPAQYHVVRVVGTVESPVLKRALKTGDVIESKDQLRFSTKDSYIIINSPQTGRKRISGVPDNSPREFLQLLQSFVQPDTKSTSTRSLSMEYLESLQNSMHADVLLVLGDGFIPVNTAKLSLAKPAIIRAWYYGDNKKVTYRDISDDKGFKLTGPALYENFNPSTPAKKVVVEYFENGNDDPIFSPGLLLGAFVPMYVDEAQLALEIRSLIETRHDKLALAEIKAYLLEEYAMAQENNLLAWLKAQGINIQ
jgi:hypothetical protein